MYEDWGYIRTGDVCGLGIYEDWGYMRTRTEVRRYMKISYGA